ncbi:MAG: hypothetical protein JWM11_7786 [Planctomycetaceae bacterium]|nr:hypothetical protein [Planctomycetaceae bacterium]
MIVSIDTDNTSAGCLMQAIRRDGRIARQVACPLKLRCSVIYGETRATRPLCVFPGRYAKYGVRKDLGKMHLDGLEPSTFGSVDRISFPNAFLMLSKPLDFPGVLF